MTSIQTQPGGHHEPASSTKRYFGDRVRRREAVQSRLGRGTDEQMSREIRDGPESGMQL